MVEKIAVLIISYLVGSFPTALILSKSFHGQDIREFGDGNMGASNAQRQYGAHAGIVVAVLDILKGVIATLLAIALRLPANWQIAAGGAAILGHDFSIFARFRGGQGLATTAGVFLVLFPIPWLIGCVAFGLVYLLSHRPNLAKGTGMGVYALFVTLWGGSWFTISSIIFVLLFVPFKKWLDRSRRVKIQLDEQNQ